MEVLVYRVSRKVELDGGLTELHIETLGCKMQNNQVRIVNTKPFKIVHDNNGIVRNYTDQVEVSVHNSVTNTISFDTISVLSVAHYTERQLDIPAPEERLTAIEEDLDKVDKLNQYVASYLNQLESDMLFEDIDKMHRQQAIDSALDAKDAKLFAQLVRGEVVTR